MQDTVPNEISAWRAQIRKGAFELAVLVLIRKQPRYGLELVELLNAANLGISEGSIYPLLSRLRVEKKVITNWVDEGTGHAHKYYELTNHGRAVCKAMLAAWAQFTDSFDGLLEKKR